MRLSLAAVRTSAGLLVGLTALVLAGIHVIAGAPESAAAVAGAGVVTGVSLARMPMRLVAGLAGAAGGFAVFSESLILGAALAVTAGAWTTIARRSTTV